MARDFKPAMELVIAVYIRLSAEDGDLSDEKNESNSVVNQRAYIHQYIRISYDLVGFIPVDELMKQETA